jgi:hypothetical protein
MVAFAGIDLFSIVSDIKVFLYNGFQTLPLTMGGTLLLLGLFTANYAALFFLVGFLVLTPLLTKLLNAIPIYDSWKKHVSTVCSLVPPFPTEMGSRNSNVSPAAKPEHYLISYWLSMGLFMFGYLFSNAYALYVMPPQSIPDADAKTTASLNEKAMYRKSQMIISFVMLSIISLMFIGVRINSGCDGIVGAAIGLLFVGLGISWFSILSQGTNARLSDLFGIANRLMSPKSMDDPTICLPLVR